MSMATAWARIGKSIMNHTPRGLGYIAAYPVFKFVEGLDDGEAWTLDYTGNGQFTYTGEITDRRLGAIETAIGIAPAAYGVVLLFLVDTFLIGAAQIAAVLVAAVYVLATIGVITEVSVSRQTGGDRT